MLVMELKGNFDRLLAKYQIHQYSPLLIIYYNHSYVIKLLASNGFEDRSTDIERPLTSVFWEK